MVSYASWSALLYVYGLEPRVYFGYQPRALPQELQTLQNAIETEYKQRFKGKKLLWVHLCVQNKQDKLQLKYGSYTLSVNFVQALLLLAFNSKPVMREEELM